MNLKDYLFILNDSALLTRWHAHPADAVLRGDHAHAATRGDTPDSAGNRYRGRALHSGRQHSPHQQQGFVLVHDQPPIVIPVSTGAVVKLIQEAANAVVEYQWTGLPS
jgi:hypothetical protein